MPENKSNFAPPSSSRPISLKIALGSDHAGFEYKRRIKSLLDELGHETQDFGTFSADPVDYPLVIRPVAQAVAGGAFDRGTVLGGHGNGDALPASQLNFIRCALG